MRILVTGGAGFVGSRFVRHVLATTDDVVTVLDSLTYAGNLANLEGLDERRLTVVEGDICERELVREVVAGHDAVVHLAAETHVDRSLRDPDVFVRTNCTGTNIVCDEARRRGIERFLHVSTDEVYGSADEGSFDESDLLRPSSPYSASKAGSDLIALSHHVSHGLPVVVARSSNQFGPHQFPEKVIPHFVTTVLEGGNVPLYGDGGNIRDWLYVDDNCAALDLVLRRGEVGEIYNVSAGEERSNLALTHAVLALLGVGDDRIRRVADRPGHDRRYSITSEKVRDLGWAPTGSFEARLEQTVQWYVDNRRWWEPLRRAP